MIGLQSVTIVRLGQKNYLFDEPDRRIFLGGGKSEICFLGSMIRVSFLMENELTTMLNHVA